MELKQIKELIKILDDSKLNKIKIKDKDFSISLNKGGKPTIQKTAPAPIQQVNTQTIPDDALEPAKDNSSKSGDTLNSPMVGTFYHAPSPKSPNFVKVGDTVSKGDTIGIIEAMKIMNEIEADFDCKVLEILVTNEQPIEFDMPLYKVEKL